MKLRLFLAAALSLAASPALGQGTISPGMTPDQVRSTFGAPAAVRNTDGWTYWYYHNGCPNRCGSDDVVFFREDRVVAAVLRTARRRFAGPRASEALEPYDHVSARGGVAAEGPVQMQVRRRADEAEAEESREPARVGGVRVETNEPAAGARQGEGPGSTIIIRPPAREGASGGRPEPTNTRTFGAVRDSAQGAPATAADDERRDREGRVEPNTVRNSPDTTNADRRARERAVQPRVVPRGNP